MDTRDNDGSSSSSSGQGSGDLSDYKKLLDDNIRRNEMSLRSFGCDPADYRSSLSSSERAEFERAEFEREREDVQRRFCFLFFEFQLILILNLMV